MSDDLMTELAVEKNKNSIITVVGVGGAGGNAVNHMWNLGIEGVDFMVCNTDKQALRKSPVEFKVLLGEDGLGAGNDPERGRQAAIISEAEIRRQFEVNGTHMLFITAGMGGGTGTGASPIIAKIAQEMGILTVAIVTTPDPVEGRTRYDQAFKGLDELRKYVDSLLVINNEHIAEIYGELSLKQAFGKADDILASAAKGIAEIITVESDLVNVDFADVKRVMTNSGRAHMGVATAEGPNRAEEATRAALNSPLLGHRSIYGADNILVNISVANSDELKQSEQRKILEILQEEAAVQDGDGYHDANIIWGTSEKPKLGKAMELVVVVTGFNEADAPLTPPVRLPKPKINKVDSDKDGDLKFLGGNKPEENPLQ
ncbi:MAG: cell division protein FtsZ, partial [Alistipes sp.]|nr:cell division protein FtsZ [Alistipes sp.]